MFVFVFVFVFVLRSALFCSRAGLASLVAEQVPLVCACAGGDCDHMFCTECLSTMMAVHVTEGSVERLLCPDCVQPLHPAVVASLLDAEQLVCHVL